MPIEEETPITEDRQQATYLPSKGCHILECEEASSCETEFISLSQAIQEAMWRRNLRSEFTDMPIFRDNQSAISIAGTGLLREI